jgi:hypothetical protein
VFAFYRDVDEAIAAITWQVDHDVVGDHDALLGVDAASLLEACEGSHSEDVSRVRDLTRDAAIAQTHGRVLLTMNSLAGQVGTGTGWPHALLGLTGASHEALTRDAATYERACTRGAMTRTVARVTFSRTSPCLGTCMGLDNTRVLPPFTPIGQQEDALFGTFLRRCYPDACTAFLPDTVPHLPPELVVQPRETIREFPGWCLNGILRVIVDWFEPDSWLKSGATRIVWFGDRLLELATLPFEEFRHFVNVRLAEALGERLQALDRLRQRRRAAAGTWAEDVRAYAAAARATIAAPVPFWPLDFERAANPLAALARCQQVFRSYAHLLRAWPAMVAVAADWNRNGASR